ncbi:MAG: hypothetical protein LJE84_09905 [Gammaproteobacteria bacterium]|jgi:hypothetical protein|nr:hypothetical protein [Gammaproteobacteria bacterium]
MPVKDSFEYVIGPGGRVGLDCAFCVHFRGPPGWPDVERASRCGRHDVPLAIQLGEGGYKEYEWFCRDFSDNGRADPSAVAHLAEMHESLQPGVLYRLYGHDRCLVEHPFDELNSG